MGYKLKAGEPADDGIRRVVLEEIDQALHAFTSSSGPPPIHEARKNVKRIRATLRLARAAFKDSTFKRENHAFRDIGRYLADVRDADVLVQAFDGIKSEFRTRQLRNAVTIVGRQLERRRRAAMASASRADGKIERAQAALQAAKERASDWRLHGKEWPTLKPGFNRTYIEGQKRFAIAYKHDSADDFHAWRKRVKDLLYQVRLLRGLWRPVFDAWHDELDTLADLLGEGHDLAVLRLIIQEKLHADLAIQERDGLVIRINDRCARLEEEAKPLGRRLYTEAATSLSARVDDYWAAWRLNKREDKRRSSTRSADSR
jgi:CHAD domain-containing protein